MDTNLYLHAVDFIRINEHALFILLQWECSFPLFLRFLTKFPDGFSYSVPIMSLQAGNVFLRNETWKCSPSYFNANSCSLFQSLSFKHHNCEKIRPNWEMHFGHRDGIVNWHLIVGSDSVVGCFRSFNWCESVSFYGNKIAQ